MDNLSAFNFGTPNRDNKSLKNIPFSLNDLDIEKYKSPNRLRSFNDRYIPKRNTPLQKDFFTLSTKIMNSPVDISRFSEQQKDKLIYSDILEKEIFNMDACLNDNYSDNGLSAEKSNGKKSKFLNFNQKKENKGSLSPVPFNSNRGKIADTELIKSIKHSRRIPKQPVKVLDAPGIADDYYSNILDWSSNDIIGVSLMNSLYLWKNTKDGNSVVNLSEFESHVFCSIKFARNGQVISAGDDAGNLHIYDINTDKKVLNFKGHDGRISTMDWCNDYILTTGSRDSKIKTFDLRSNSCVSVLEKHTQEICGLKWNFNESYLASGGNENHIFIWDIRKNNPVKCFAEHKAAVRALAWSPLNFGILISGGGNNDKTIKFWNLNEDFSTATIPTNSQVCNLVFSKHSNEFLSTHGYSDNCIMVWNSDKKERVAILDGHQTRVLHLAISPDGENVASCAADETLKFWKVFPRDTAMEEETPTMINSFLELR